MGTNKKEGIFGIDLIPETHEEYNITERFFAGGVKVNGYSSCGVLSLTFKDLIEDDEVNINKARLQNRLRVPRMAPENNQEALINKISEMYNIVKHISSLNHTTGIEKEFCDVITECAKDEFIKELKKELSK